MPARKKSPRSPSMALGEALEKVQRAYDKAGLVPTPTDVLAQYLGYKNANNGAALQAMATARYFGLLERPKEGYLAVSSDFERYRYVPDELQRRELLTRFLRAPALYDEVLSAYPERLPEDAHLRFELIERGFNPIAAESALVVFRKSVEFAGFYQHQVDQDVRVPSVAFDASDAESVSDGAAGGVHQEGTAVSPVQQAASVVREMPAVVGTRLGFADQSCDQIPVRLPGGRKAWLVIPSPFFSSDKIRLKAQIDLLLAQDEENDGA